MAKKAPGQHVVATNRKARHDYSILEVYEAGLVLLGTEVKSLRDGKASLADAYATVDDGEVWLRNLHIPEYHHGTWTNHEPRRNRKLLLHRRQISARGAGASSPGALMARLLLGRHAAASSPGGTRVPCSSSAATRPHRRRAELECPAPPRPPRGRIVAGRWPPLAKLTVTLATRDDHPRPCH